MKDEPAFPEVHGENTTEGLTKLEWFAAMALQGILACPVWTFGSEKIAATEAFDIVEAMCIEASKRKAGK